MRADRAVPLGAAPDPAGGATGVVAGVVIETAPGAEPRVAARLAGRAGITLAGGDGAHRIAAVFEAADAEALERLAEELLAGDEEILGVFPTFVGDGGAEPS